MSLKRVSSTVLLKTAKPDISLTLSESVDGPMHILTRQFTRVKLGDFLTVATDVLVS